MNTRIYIPIITCQYTAAPHIVKVAKVTAKIVAYSFQNVYVIVMMECLVGHKPDIELKEEGRGMKKIYPEPYLLDARTSPKGKIRFLQVCNDQLGSNICPNCSGLGFMYVFYSDAGPFERLPNTKKTVKYIEDEGWYIGKIKGQPCPVCAEGNWDVYLADISGLEGDDLEIRVSDFHKYQGKEEAKDVAGQLLSLTPSPIGFVTFHGDYGVGKTHILKALVNGFRVANIPSVYTRMSELLADVRSGFDQPKSAAEAILSEYGGCRVLAIDEVDRIKLTDWAMETMFRLLDGRYEARGTALTLLATNLNPAEMPEELRYLASRIQGGVVVEIAGEDMRLAQGVTARQEVMEV